MVPESKQGLTSTIFPEPCAVVRLGNRHISYSQEAGGPTVLKQVKRSGQELHQEGICHLEYFVLFENCKASFRRWKRILYLEITDN